MLVGTGVRNGGGPHRAFGNAGIQSTDRNATCPNGALRNMPMGYARTSGQSAKAGRPNGYRHPAAWVLPDKPGGLGSYDRLTGSGDFTGSGAMGLNAVASLTGTGDLTVTGQLIVSAIATLTGSGDLSGNVVALLNAVASIAGTGDLTATADALGWTIAALAGSGTFTTTIYASGELAADITPFTELSPESLAAAVWGTTTSTLDDDGTTGYALRVLNALGRNRVVTDPSGGTFTVYDDDNTVLLTGDLWQDAAGTVAYAGSGAERRDRLT